MANDHLLKKQCVYILCFYLRFYFLIFMICFSDLGNLEVVRVLLEYNADVEQRNCNGKTSVDRLVETISAGIGSAQDDACLALLLSASRWPFASWRFGLRDGDAWSPTPPPLIHLSRFAVRRSMRRGRVSHLVEQLNVPIVLRQYLALEAPAIEQQ